MSELITPEEFINDKEFVKALQNINKELQEVLKTIGVASDVVKKYNLEVLKGADSHKKLADNQKLANDSTKKLSDVEKEIQKIEEKHYQTLTKMVAERSEENKKLEEATAKRAKENISRKEELKLVGAQINSIARLSKENKDLIKERNSLNTATVAGSKRIDEINKSIDRNNLIIKANSSNLEKQRLNIGNYRSALSDLSPEFANLNNKATMVIGAMAKMGGGFGLGVGSIIAVGAQLTAFFTMSERGAELLERKLSGVKAAFGLVVDEVIKGGEALVEKSGLSEKGTSGFWTRFFTGISMGNMSVAAFGARLDAVSTIAEQTTGKLQELEDIERAMIVPRAIALQQLAEARDAYNEVGISIDDKREKLIKSIDIESKATNDEIDRQNQIITNLEKIINIQGERVRDSDLLKLEQAKAKAIELQTTSIANQRKAKANLRSLEEEYSKETLSNFGKEWKAKEDVIEKETKTKKDSLKQQWDDAQKALEAEYAGRDVDLADFKEKEKQKAEAVKEAEKQKQAAIEETKMLQIDSANAVFDLSQAFISREASKLDAKRDKDIKAAGDNAKKKERIEADYQKKMTAIKRKAAIVDKIQALFNIGINTRLGVLKAVAQLGVAAPPIIAWIRILGALQAAAVLAQPIPKFFKGVKDFKGGAAVVGEKGMELVETPKGSFLTPDKATTMLLPEHSTVHTHEKTIEKLKGMDSEKVNELINEQRLTRKAIANQVHNSTTLTQDGLEYARIKGNSRTKMIDKYFRT